jgi:hypothetical protein
LEAHGVSGDIVVQLLDAADLLGRGVCAVTDNWYTSPGLALSLRAQHTDLLGTVKAKRIAEELQLKPGAQRGDVAFFVSERDPRISAYAVMDNDVVRFVDSHLGNVREDIRRWDKGTRRYDVFPGIKGWSTYCRVMGGVDQFDYMRCSRRYGVSMGHKVHKWTHRLLAGMLDIALTNVVRCARHLRHFSLYEP